MKKVVCPQCGLVNLEKFVTFPHCAACGALLTADDEQQTLFWRRPVLPSLWASLVGLCCVALAFIGLSIARETRRSEDKRLLIYAQLPLHAIVGRHQIAQFSLDTIEGDTQVSQIEFNDVRLRLSRTTLDNFTLEQVMPMPDTLSSSGSGRYLQWDTLPMQQPIRFLLVPRRTGTRDITFSLFARGFQPFLLHRKIDVTQESAAKNAATRAPRPRLPNLKTHNNTKASP